MRAFAAAGLLVTWSLIGTALAAGCDDSLRSAGALDESPQILAVWAEPPDLHAGESVTFDALVHWPDGSPTYVWMVCVPDVGETLTSCLADAVENLEGPPPSCDGAPSGTRFCLAGMGERVSYRVPEGLFPDDGERHTFFVNLLVSAEADGLLACADILTGGPATGDCLLALKRVQVSPGPPYNLNPEIAGMELDGARLGPFDPIRVSAAGQPMEDFSLRVGVIVDAGSVDEMVPEQGDPEPATLVASWFADCGSLDPERSFVRCDPSAAECAPSEVTWSPGQSGTCHLHVVVRDGRGGMAVRSRTVQVQADGTGLDG